MNQCNVPAGTYEVCSRTINKQGRLPTRMHLFCVVAFMFEINLIHFIFLLLIKVKERGKRNKITFYFISQILAAKMLSGFSMCSGK